MQKTSTFALTGLIATLSIAYGVQSFNQEAAAQESKKKREEKAIQVHPKMSSASVRFLDPSSETHPGPLSTPSLYQKRENVSRRKGRNSTPRVRKQSGVPPTISQGKGQTESQESPLLSVVDQPDIRKEDRQLLSDALRAFPALCRENIKHLVVRYDQNIERGQATSNSIVLRGGLPEKEMVAVLLHECGHIIDLGALRGSPHSGISAYPDGTIATYQDDPSVRFYETSWETPERTKEYISDEDFVSGYAKQDAFEDLAESMVYYAFQQTAFRERAQSNAALASKLKWLETYIFGSQYTPISSRSWNGQIAWDTTKLPYELEL